MDQLLRSGDMEFFPPGVFKIILNEVKKSCLEVDIVVHEQLVSVIIKLLSLDPSHGLHLDGKLDRRSLGSYVRKCIDVLLGELKILSNKFKFSNKIILTIREIQWLVSHFKYANVLCGAYN